MTTHATFIDNLGGATKLADRLSAVHADGPFDYEERKRLRDRIYRWKVEDTIPHRWRPWVRRVAREDGISVPEDLQDPAEAA